MEDRYRGSSEKGENSAGSFFFLPFSCGRRGLLQENISEYVKKKENNTENIRDTIHLYAEGGTGYEI